MIDYLRSNSLILILLLSTAALLFLLLQLWRKHKQGAALERDKSGYWKYHKESQFLLKSAYGRQLSKKSDQKDKNATDKDAPASKEEAEEEPKSIAVLEFDGDLKAKQHDSFARLVDEVVLNKDRFEEIVVKVSSPGGAVPHYGHVFAEMKRLREVCPQLTACVDVVAASGGYLAALPAHQILAAPFAMLGSIGVVAFVPNIRRFLQRYDIQPRTFTAGNYKRTVTLTDDATQEEIAHFESQLEAIHRLFLEQAKAYRPHMNFEAIETGDAWTAAESQERELGLVDSIKTSQEYLLERNAKRDVLFISSKKGFFEDGLFRFGGAALRSLERRLTSTH